MKSKKNIIIKGARVHNLKNINLEIPHNKLVVFTGVSGSGKSSLAFDTIFAEGQRRYIESLSPYARQFLGQMKPADVDEIIGLAPSISIDQKALSRNPRSTVGTLTEIYDYLRVLYARLGEVFCPKCGHKIEKLALDEMVDIIRNYSLSTKKNHHPEQETSHPELVSGSKSKKRGILKQVQDDKKGVSDDNNGVYNDKKGVSDDNNAYVTILSPVVIDRKGEYYQLLYDYLSLGYSEARIDGEFHSLHEKVKLARHKKHSIDIVIDKVLITDEGRLSEAIENALEYSSGLVIGLYDKEEEQLLSANWTCPNDNFAFPEVEPRLFSFNSPHGACENCHGLGHLESWEKMSRLKVGIPTRVSGPQKYKKSDKNKTRWTRVIRDCKECRGQRLKPEALSVKVGGKNIAEVSDMSLSDAYDFFEKFFEKMTKRQRDIAESVVVEIVDRLNFLKEVGLSYLTLSREAATLSGGEAQRIRLSSQIGSHLSHTLYVLDEPTIGLHEKDTEKLIKTLKSLRDQNNSVIIVEHDERTIRESDYLVDLGPQAGVGGGEIVAQGEIKELLKKTSKIKSMTLDYLRGEKDINSKRPIRDKETEKLKIIGARANNLKNIAVEIPLRKLVGITGVSGSGKSSLMYEVLYKNVQKIKHNPRLATKQSSKELENVSKIIGTEYVSKVVIIDQSPIGRTPRSNPATYTGIFTPIRKFFAQLPQSRERGYTLSRFSFNRAGGRCESCGGAGYNLIEMHFLPAVEVECDVCHGKRFNRETLQVKHKGKNIAEVLSLTVDEAVIYFDGIYQITDKLKVLQEVGLGYLQLGQSATTLSGGEAQRIKIARELTHTLGKRTLYLLDEPTVGLHYHDIEMLLEVLNKLVDRENTVMVIEHNMHMIKEMDYIIDLGPEGGAKGGRVVAKGTPYKITASPKSITGDYLRGYLK